MGLTIDNSAEVDSKKLRHQKMTDLIGGRESILANYKAYGIGLSGYTDEENLWYGYFGSYHIVVPAIADGFVASTFSRSPVSQFPIDLDDVDCLGNNIDQYSALVFQIILLYGYCVTLNDYSDDQQKSKLIPTNV